MDEWPSRDFWKVRADSFWAVSTGFRLFFGGGPMRMGSYGVLDPMSGAMLM